MLYTGNADLSNRIRIELTSNLRTDSPETYSAAFDFKDKLWPQICVAGVENMQQGLRSTLQQMDALVWPDIHVQTSANMRERNTKIPRILQRALPTSAK